MKKKLLPAHSLLKIDREIGRCEPIVKRFAFRLHRRFFSSKNNLISHEDVAQEAMIKLFKVLSNGPLVSTMENNRLWVITRSVMLDLWKHLHRKKRGSETFNIELDSTEVECKVAPKSNIISHFEEYLCVINEFINNGRIKLTKKQSELVGCLNQGFVQTREIAEALNIPESAARERKNRFYDLVRRSVSRDEIEALRFKLFGGIDDSDS